MHLALMLNEYELVSRIRMNGDVDVMLMVMSPHQALRVNNIPKADVFDQCHHTPRLFIVLKLIFPSHVECAGLFSPFSHTYSAASMSHTGHRAFSCPE